MIGMTYSGMNGSLILALLCCISLLPHSPSTVALFPETTDEAEEPFPFFRQYVGLNEEEITAIRNGKPVAKVLNSPTADQVFVFGAVYVRSNPENYLKLASDIEALKKLPNYLAIRKFSNPPRISDLDGFSLDEEDINGLKKCHEGKCEVQLPKEAMDEFRSKINWSAPDVTDQVNQLARQMALGALTSYREGGNAALGTYRDKNDPAAIEQTFRSLVERSKALPVYLPELQNYLLNYPKTKSDHIESEFYWEKINFGLKPTIRLLQAVLYRGEGSTGPAYAVAIKQLYASHYFETALDLTVCVRDEKHRPGMYLITMKGSQQAGLTGLKGGIVRKVAVDKTRSALEKALGAMKTSLESQAN